MIAPVLKFISRPLELVIPMSKVAGLHVEENVELAIWRSQNHQFRLNNAKDMKWNLFEDIRVDVLNTKNRNIRNI